MGINKEERRGIAFVLLAALVSGVSVFVNSVGVKGVDPFAYTVFKNVAAGIFIAASIAVLGTLSEFRTLKTANLKRLAAITVVGGSVPFLMFFWGLSLTGGAEGSFIYRFLFAFSALFAAAALREKIDWKFAAGALAAIAGNVLLLGPNAIHFGFGEALVLGATLLWSAEWVLTKPLLAEIPGRVVAAFRMLGGSLVMIAIIVAGGRAGTLVAFDASVVAWSAFVGALLFLYLTAWYEGLARTTVGRATALLALAGPITTLLDLTLSGKPLPFLSALGFLLMTGGILLAVGIAESTAALPEAGRLALEKLAWPVRVALKWKD